jgi:NAD(P)H dehydrogenase (quinone)
MNIGIIIHSQTGNTNTVAMKLMEKLLALGHNVNLEKVVPVDEKQTVVGNVQLKAIPETGIYDALIFGAPVRGAAVSPAMAAYLKQISSFQNKKTACFVTEFFPFPWMGGNRAISQLREACESKGAKVTETGVVNWSGKNREKKITDLVEKLSRSF